MADTFKLAKPEYQVVPAGEHVTLTIDKIAAKPKANPSIIEVTFKHADGSTLLNKYDLVKKLKPTDKNPIGLYLFSLLVYATLGNDKEDFSISRDLPTMKGKAVDCKVEHVEGTKGGTFANIKKVHGPATVEEAVEETIETDDDL